MLAPEHACVAHGDLLAWTATQPSRPCRITMTALCVCVWGGGGGGGGGRMESGSNLPQRQQRASISTSFWASGLGRSCLEEVSVWQAAKRHVGKSWGPSGPPQRSTAVDSCLAERLEGGL